MMVSTRLRQFAARCAPCRGFYFPSRFNAAMLIVRVCGGVHRARRGLELEDLLEDASGALILGNLDAGENGPPAGDEEREQDG